MEQKLKLVIIDDEILIRDLLKRCVNWDDIGIEISGEASDSDEALELVESIIPDIVITDVCLPYIDGVELSRLIIEKHPHTKIIVLTGHQEFEYAKRSVKVGVSEFLTKPINASELMKVVGGIKEKIELEKVHYNEFINLKKQLEQSLSYTKEKFFTEIIQGSISKNEIMNKLHYLNIEIYDNNFQVVMLDVEKNEIYNDETEGQLFKIQCIEFIKQFFKAEKYVSVFLYNSQRILILNNDKDIDIVESCNTLEIMLINELNCFVSIGIGNKFDSIEKIQLSFREACEALNYCTTIGKNQIFCYSAIQTYKFQTKKLCKIIEDIQKYLLENISDFELSLPKVAKAFYINSSYLSRLFKLETGISFVEYLTNLRVEKALIFLKESDMKVYEISEKVGILDPHYLGVCFKKYTGMTISEYKRRLLEK